MTWLRSLRFPLTIILLGTVLLLTNPTLAGAAQELNLPTVTTPQPVEFPSMLWLFVKMVFSLVIIAGLAFLMVRVLKKNMQPNSAGDWFNIVDQYALGTNKGVYLAEIAGKAYILGVSDQSINILGEFNDRDRLEEIKREVAAREELPPAARNLLRNLADFFNKNKGGRRSDFHSHILNQIQRLQHMSGSSGESAGREKDSRD